jgi:large-conductance mechanosensitive channel
MFTFLLEEGVLTVGALSGIFTATLLGSFKSNILDPFSENIFPSHELDKHAQPTQEEFTSDKDILDANNYKSKFGKKNNAVLWQTFIKDLILWLIIMFIIYIIWKKIIKNIKKPNGI